MKKLLAIVVLGLMWCNTSYSEGISTDKSVNKYLTEGWKIISIDSSGHYVFLYHLKKGQELITCQYQAGTEQTQCWKP